MITLWISQGLLTTWQHKRLVLMLLICKETFIENILLLDFLLILISGAGTGERF